MELYHQDYLNHSGAIAFEDIWADHYGQPLHEYDYRKLFNRLEQTVRKSDFHFLFDLAEWLVQHTPDGYAEIEVRTTSEDFNRILARNRAGYRIVDLQVVSITNEAELSAITTAIAMSSTPAANHLEDALALFATATSRTSPSRSRSPFPPPKPQPRNWPESGSPLGESLDVVRGTARTCTERSSRDGRTCTGSTESTAAASVTPGSMEQFSRPKSWRSISS